MLPNHLEVSVEITHNSGAPRRLLSTTFKLHKLASARNCRRLSSNGFVGIPVSDLHNCWPRQARQSLSLGWATEHHS